MATAVFNFEDGTSGKITHAGLGYTAATGWARCDTGQDTSTGNTWRAYFNFDTSSLDDTAVVSKVEFYQKLSVFQPLGTPDVLKIQYSIGTFIGDTLDGNVTEWNAGTLVHDEYQKQNNVWIDISNLADPNGLVSLTGDTDLKIWDVSTQGEGDSYWGTDFNTPKIKCQLRVTYTIPITVSMDALTAACSPKSFIVVPGGVSLVMDALSLAGSPQSMVLSPGGVNLSMDALSMGASVGALVVVPGATSVILDALSATASVQPMVVVPGDVTMLMNALSGTLETQQFTIIVGAAEVFGENYWTFGGFD